MKKFLYTIFSLKIALVLLLVFAISIAWATFVENDFGTETAMKLIYVSTWFEVLLWALGINLLGNMFVYRVFRKEKLTILIFHLSFLLILGGGAVTRYLGYEGTMHIREGKSSNFIELRDDYLTVNAIFNGESTKVESKVLFTERGKNRFSNNLNVGEHSVKIRLEEYYENAEEALVPTEKGGVPAIDIFIMRSDQKSKEYKIVPGDQIVVEDMLYQFGVFDGAGLVFNYVDNKLQFRSAIPVVKTGMMTADSTLLAANEVHTVQPKTLYHVGEQIFVVREVLANAVKSIRESEQNNGQPAVRLLVSSSEQEQEVALFKANALSQPAKLVVNGIQLELSYGVAQRTLPFELVLNDFQLERYPGSMSPSSYASEVTLVDAANQVKMPYRIYMNNILKYKGYRFFQSSYDTDERGTILSVSHDQWGAWISYAGYLLMGIGMLLSLIAKRSRFRFLVQQTNSKMSQFGNLKLVIILLLANFFIQPISASAQGTIDETAHLKKLNTLLVQNHNGRVEPLSTISSQILRKLYKKETYQQYSATEVILGMLNNPSKWQTENLLVVKHDGLAEQLGATEGHISFAEMFDENGYRIKAEVNQAYQKDPAIRNKYDKELINLDERVNIMYQLLNGSMLKLFPIPNDENNTWANVYSFPNEMLDSTEFKPALIYQTYLNEANVASTSGNYEKAVHLLDLLIDFQQKYGAEVVPSPTKVKWENLYHQYNIFNKLAYFFQSFGFLLLLINFWFIFKPGPYIRKVHFVAIVVTIAAIIVYTFGLALRWYLSGHAPWSNGYEAMVFVGWGTALWGLFFSRKSHFALSVTNLLAGIMLMVASMSWMNPQITPLVPVLKSYWLIIHVAGNYN